MMLDTREYTREGSCRTARRCRCSSRNSLTCLCADLHGAWVLARGTARPTNGHSYGKPPPRAVSLAMRQPKNRNGLLYNLRSGRGRLMRFRGLSITMVGAVTLLALGASEADAQRGRFGLLRPAPRPSRNGPLPRAAIISPHFFTSCFIAPSFFPFFGGGLPFVNVQV